MSKPVGFEDLDQRRQSTGAIFGGIARNERDRNVNDMVVSLEWATDAALNVESSFFQHLIQYTAFETGFDKGLQRLNQIIEGLALGRSLAVDIERRSARDVPPAFLLDLGVKLHFESDGGHIGLDDCRCYLPFGGLLRHPIISALLGGGVHQFK